MKHLLIGIAAAALVAAGVQAGPGNGRGQGNDKAQQARGAAAGDRGQGPSMSSAAQDRRGPSMKASENRGNAAQPPRASARDERGNANRSAGNAARGNANASANRATGNAERGNANARADRSGGNAGAPARSMRRDGDNRIDFGRRDGRLLDDGRRLFDTPEQRRWWADDRPRGLIDGCPPGLAKKRNGCRPPGLARQDDRYRYRSYRPDWWGLGALGPGDGRYFYDDGYLLRYDGDRVLGYVPLLAGALSVGEPWPSFYAPRPVPDYYVDYYGLGPADGYRYADNVLYRVDPETEAITSIAALLTGDDIRVGQPLPAGYDVYNVPYSHRSQYADRPDAWHRYSDGYVYQVDPETRLVAAAIELLAS